MPPLRGWGEGSWSSQGVRGSRAGPHPRRLPASVLCHAASRVIPRSPPSPRPSSPGAPARPQGPPPGLRPPLCFLVPQMFLSLTMTTCQWNSAARASRSGFLRAAGRLKAPASLAAEWGSGSAAPLGSRSRPGTHTRRRVQRGSAHAHPGARAVARFHAPWREGQGWSCGAASSRFSLRRVGRETDRLLPRRPPRLPSWPKPRLVFSLSFSSLSPPHPSLILSFDHDPGVVRGISPWFGSPSWEAGSDEPLLGTAGVRPARRSGRADIRPIGNRRLLYSEL